MSLKDLFQKSEKSGESKTLEEISDETDSSQYVKEYVEHINKFSSDIDYSEPENFVVYGSAEEYYVNTIQRTYKTYPYDGSKGELYDWINKSSELDLFFLKNEYPTRVGYGIFGTPEWSPGAKSSASFDGKTYYSSSDPTYIHLRGGPHTGSADSKDVINNFGEFNTYDTASNRGDNLKFDLSGGLTVEFWAKLSSSSPNEASTIFDLWNQEPSSSTSYGRYTIELSSSGDALLSYHSGTSNNTNHKIASPTSSIDTSDWHHYAIRSYNSSSNVVSDLYLDGVHQEQVSSSYGTSFGAVTGNLQAYIGAFQTSLSGTQKLGKGWSSLSGSIDEFRYWKTKRTGREIGRHWNTIVYGGADKKNGNTELGVYYKFNEGVTGDNSLDSTTLDYSGRVTNGTWVNYSTAATRSLSSSMEVADASPKEKRDPIIYASHPDVSELETSWSKKGQVYDAQNHSSIYETFPQWMIDEDEGQTLLELTQILSSYFDTLQTQVSQVNNLKDIYYQATSGSSPLPFADRLVENYGMVTPEIFPQMDVVEKFESQDNSTVFEKDLHEIKNSIYHNIYDNLVQIYKRKGTEPAVRNLLRCYGIDEELVQFSLYEDNSDLVLEDKFSFDDVQKKAANFYDPDHLNATIYQQTASSRPQSVSYISSSHPDDFAQYYPNSLEAEVVFPKKFELSNNNYFSSDITTASLCGVHSIDTSAPDKIKWPQTKSADVQLYAVKNSKDSSRVKFVASSSGGNFPELHSRYINDVYSDERWNLSLTVKPENQENIGIVSGNVSTGSYQLEFHGINTLSDEPHKEFHLSKSIGFDLGSSFLTSSKRMYAGAHKEDYTGSIKQKTDVRVTDVRYWFDEIDEDTLEFHAKAPNVFGNQNVYQNSFLSRDSLKAGNIPSVDLLALHWQFENVTSSSDSGKFRVDDYTSGSNELSSRYDWLGGAVNRQHTGRAAGFVANTGSVVKKQSLDGLSFRYFEKGESFDDVSVSDSIGEKEKFRRLRYPSKKQFRLEKSLAGVINRKALEWFGSVDEFHNLIGELKNRYRPNYKELEKLRQIFYERFGDKSTVERFVKFYRWFDNSISKFIEQLIPASAEFSGKLENTIENTLFNRNKYRSKFPTLEFEVGQPSASIEGANFYDWEFGHAPIPLSEDDNYVWWKYKADRDNPTISSGDSDVDESRNEILSASQQSFEREQRSPLNESFELSESADNERKYGVGKIRSLLSSSKKEAELFRILSSSYVKKKDVTDNDALQRHSKATFQANLENVEGDTLLRQDSGRSLPFSLFSSSITQVSGTYLEKFQKNFRSSVEVGDLHRDFYDGRWTNNVMQSPFAYEVEGGSAHVVEDLNTPKDGVVTDGDIINAFGTQTSILHSGSERHVVYYNPNKCYFLKYIKSGSGGWNGKAEIEGPSKNIDAGVWPDLDSGSNGNLYVSYLHAENNEIKLAQSSSTGWTKEVIDSTLISASKGNKHTSIAVDSDNVPHVSYYSGESLKYAFREGDQWCIQSFKPLVSDDEGQYSSIDLDDDGRPYIGYNSSGSTIGSIATVVKLRDRQHRVKSASVDPSKKMEVDVTYGNIDYTQAINEIEQTTVGIVANQSYGIDVEFYDDHNYTNKIIEKQLTSSVPANSSTVKTVRPASPHARYIIHNSGSATASVSGTFNSAGNWWEREELSSRSGSKGYWNSLKTETLDQYNIVFRDKSSQELVHSISSSTGIISGAVLDSGGVSASCEIFDPGGSDDIRVFHIDDTNGNRVRFTKSGSNVTNKTIVSGEVSGLDSDWDTGGGGASDDDFYLSYYHKASKRVESYVTGNTAAEDKSEVTPISLSCGINALDKETDRPELFRIEYDSDNNLVVKHGSNQSPHNPSHKYYRDFIARRAVNIKNILRSKNDPIGNYDELYEIVQTSGRSINNHWFAKNSEKLVKSNGEKKAPEVPVLTGNFDHKLPERSASKHVFVNRFSSPGTTASLSRGYLDPESEEFSIYATLNYRNLEVRGEQDTNWRKHFDPFDSATFSSSIKTPKNVRRTKNEDGTINLTYDNDWVSHAMPRTTFDYRWVTASAERGEQDDQLPYSYTTGSEDISFVTSSEEKF